MALTRYVLIAYACVYVARAQYGSPSAETGSSSYGSGSPASPSSGGYGGKLAVGLSVLIRQRLLAMKVVVRVPQNASTSACNTRYCISIISSGF